MKVKESKMKRISIKEGQEHVIKFMEDAKRRQEERDKEAEFWESDEVFSLDEFVKKYLPNSELIIVNKKDVEQVKLYISTLNGDGYHDVDELYKK